MEKYRTRAVALWILLSAGFALHCVADVLPIFWSVDVAVDASAQMPQAMLLFMMSLSFFVPAVGVLSLLYSDSRWTRAVNSCWRVAVMLFNFVHSAELGTLANWGQLAILPLMDVLGVLLVADSVRLCRAKEEGR